MKFKRLSLLFFVVIAAFSFNSCSNDEPDAKHYIEYEYVIEVSDGYSMIYDVTCTYTNIFTGEVEKKAVGNMGENLFYGRGENIKAKEIVVKVEGKLKDNAKEIVEDAIAKHKIVTIGYKFRGKANAYSDPDCTKFAKEVFSFLESTKIDGGAEGLMNYVENHPTYVICDIHRTIK